VSSQIHFRQITDADIGPVADLLAQGFRRSTAQNFVNIFARLAEHPTPEGFAKYGYLMLSEGAPIGAIVVVSSMLRRHGVATIRCNLSSWYVPPDPFASLFISRILRNKDVT